MFTEIYVEALLVDEDLADQVWKEWDTGKIDDQIACIASMLIVERPLYTQKQTLDWHDGEGPLTTQSGPS